MTILPLADFRLEVCARGATGMGSLRAWLADRWAILFSHPEDFAQEQLEMDRWISVLSHSFSAAGIAPLALARAGCDPESGWLGHLGALGPESAAVLALDPPLSDTLADLSTSALHAAIARVGHRFAMIIDPNVRCRRALSYRLPAELPSPLDLVGWAIALRKRDRTEASPREALQPPLPIRLGWTRDMRHTFAQAARG
jgi:hypothetical protein